MDADVDYPPGWLPSPAFDAVLVEDLIRDGDDEHYVESSHPNQDVLLRRGDPAGELAQLAVAQRIEPHGHGGGLADDFEVIVVDEELAAGKVKGVLAVTVLLPQRLQHLLGLLVLIIMWEENGLILIALLKLLALLPAELEDLVDGLPQHLAQLLQRKATILFRATEE